MGFVVLIILVVFVYLLSIANMHVVCKKMPVISDIARFWKRMTQPKPKDESKKQDDYSMLDFNSTKSFSGSDDLADIKLEE